MIVLVFIVFLSIMFQLLSAILAVKLTAVTGKRNAWLLIALGISLMALRRIESLFMLVSGQIALTPSFTLFEIVGLITSLLMFSGIYYIKPLFVSIVRSGEELHSMNEQLGAVSQEQKLLLDHTRDFIYRHDTAGMITYVSPAVEKITGYRPEEWLVHFSHHYTDNPKNEQGRTATEEMLKTGGATLPYVIEVRHKAGRTVWLEINKQPYFTEGKIAGAIGVARDITPRVLLEQEREKLIADFQEALANIKALRGMLPICSSCKKIRDDKGYWNQIESYISEHSEAEFTHGICPDCAKKLYPEFALEATDEEKK